MGKYLSKTGVQTVWDKVKQYVNNITKTGVTDKLGAANGIATLDSNSKLNESQLPNLKTINNESIIGSGNITIDLNLYVIVSSLPTQNIDSNKIYLVVANDDYTENKYNEYIYVNGTWELIGSYRSEIELADYIKKTDLATDTKNGLMSSNDFSKLAGIAEQATKDEAITDEELEEILI